MKRGFSLIEVTAASAILFLILSGMLGIFWQGFGVAKESQSRSTAYSLAREKLEEKTAISPWPPLSETRAAVAGFAGFERELVVTWPYLGYSDLAYIKVTVWWDNGTRSQAFETLKANY